MFPPQRVPDLQGIRVLTVVGDFRTLRKYADRLSDHISAWTLVGATDQITDRISAVMLVGVTDRISAETWSGPTDPISA